MAKNRKLPVYPERCADCAKRMVEGDAAKTMSRIPPIMANGCEVYLVYYHGSRPALAWHLLKYHFKSRLRGIQSKILMGICDRMGWTKLYHCPETATHREYWHRHGRKCHGSPNCNNMNCIDEGVPRWFKRITFWKDLKDV